MKVYITMDSGQVYSADFGNESLDYCLPAFKIGDFVQFNPQVDCKYASLLPERGSYGQVVDVEKDGVSVLFAKAFKKGHSCRGTTKDKHGRFFWFVPSKVYEYEWESASQLTKVD